MPNSRVAGAEGIFGHDDGEGTGRRWPGDGIAFVDFSIHHGLLPRLLLSLLVERRAVKRRIKELAAGDIGLTSVLEARQLALKLLAVSYLVPHYLTVFCHHAPFPTNPSRPKPQKNLIFHLLRGPTHFRVANKLLPHPSYTLRVSMICAQNASYGFCGADTSHLRCKPLAEACLRYGNHYCQLASRLIEEQGAACPVGASALWPQAAVIYANTDSVFVSLPGRTAAEAAAAGREMAKYVSSHTEIPADLDLEFERVLFPCFLDAHNRYAGAEYISGEERAPTLHQKGLLDRTQAPFIQRSIIGMLERLLLDGDEKAALEYAARASIDLLSGEVASHEVLARPVPHKL